MDVFPALGNDKAAAGAEKGGWEHESEQEDAARHLGPILIGLESGVRLSDEVLAGEKELREVCPEFVEGTCGRRR